MCIGPLGPGHEAAVQEVRSTSEIIIRNKFPIKRPMQLLPHKILSFLNESSAATTLFTIRKTNMAAQKDLSYNNELPII